MLTTEEIKARLKTVSSKAKERFHEKYNEPEWSFVSNFLFSYGIEEAQVFDFSLSNYCRIRFNHEDRQSEPAKLPKNISLKEGSKVLVQLQEDMAMQEGTDEPWESSYYEIIAVQNVAPTPDETVCSYDRRLEE